MTLLRTKNASLSPPKTTEWPTWMNTFVWHNHPKTFIKLAFLCTVYQEVFHTVRYNISSTDPIAKLTTSMEFTGKGCLATRLWVSTLCFTASELREIRLPEIPNFLYNTAVALLPMSNTNHTNLSHGEEVLRLSPIDSRAPDLLRTIVNTMYLVRTWSPDE